MDAIAQFLAKEPLFRCERLDASITQKQCAANKNRQENLSKDIWTCHPCKGCSGLTGEAIKSLEDLNMAHAVCIVKGCTKLAQKQGKCKAHLNGSTPRQARIKPDVPVVADKAPVEVSGAAFANAVVDHVGRAARVQVQEIIARPADLPAIPDVVHAAGVRSIGGHEAVILSALREMYQEIESGWLSELQGLKPCAALVRGAALVEKLQGLGC